MTDPRCQIDLLGALRVVRGAESVTRFSTRKNAALLAYLAHRLGRPQPREALIDLLWPDADLELGRRSLRTALTSLRHQLEPPGVPQGSVLLADRATVALNPAVVTTDIRAFEAALASAKSASRIEEKRQRLSDALTHYGGTLLPGHYEEWVPSEAARLSELHLGALRELTGILEQCGDLSGALQHARQAVTVEPLREAPHGELIRLLIQSGQEPEARRQWAALGTLLREELGTVPSASLQKLVDGWLQSGPAPAPATLRTGLPPVSAAQAFPIDPGSAPPEMPPLPSEWTRFFGRVDELGRLRQWLAAAAVAESGERLVTLSGPGGVGKTRLALRLASALREEYGGRVVWVALADLSDPRLIPDALARALGLPPAQGDPLAQVAEFLGDGPCLLVVDNLEQLGAGAAPSVQSLLSRLPQSRILATSRTRLLLPGEREFPLTPLPVTPDGESTGEGELAQVAGLPSVQLFVDRAQAVRPDFQVTARNAGDLVRLATRLEGIPLALELAAARASVLTPAQMVERLEHRLEWLETRKADRPERHRSMRAAVEWSYELLGAGLRGLFRRLAVFRGGWSLGAAEAVAVDASLTAVLSPLDALAQLRASSLVQVDAPATSGAEPRFRMLESLREFALEQLSPEELTAAYQAHLGCFLDQAEEAAAAMDTPGQQEAMDLLESERDNLRAALAWSREAEPLLALRLAGALGRFWRVGGYQREGFEWLESVLATTEREATARELQSGDALRWKARALHGAGGIAFDRLDYPAAERYFNSAVSLWEALVEWEQAGMSRVGLAMMHYQLGDLQRSREQYEKLVPLVREGSDLSLRARVIGGLGQIAYILQDADPEPLYLEALACQQERGNVQGQGALYHALGNLFERNGDRLEARRHHELALACRKEARFRQGIIYSHFSLSALASGEGDFERARPHCEEGLRLAREIGDEWSIGMGLKWLASIHQGAGEYAEAERLCREGLRLQWKARDMQHMSYLLRGLADAALALGRLENAVTLHAATDLLQSELGGAMSTAPPVASNLREEARSRLGDRRYDAATERGTRMPIEEVVQLALEG